MTDVAPSTVVKIYVALSAFAADVVAVGSGDEGVVALDAAAVADLALSVDIKLSVTLSAFGVAADVGIAVGAGDEGDGSVGAGVLLMLWLLALFLWCE